MSNIAIQGAATGTGVFTLASPATNTDRVLTLPDEAGTVLTSASPTVLPKGLPTFRVQKNAAQYLSISVYNKVVWDNNETWDEGACFDVTNNRFQPSVAGYYQVNTTLEMSYGSGGPSYWKAAFYKNGSEYGIDAIEVGDVVSIAFSEMVYMNGSTDYVEVFVYPNGGGTVGVYPGSAFSAFLARAA